MRVVAGEEMRRIDRYAIRKIGIPEAVLMESAGRSVFAEIRRREGTVEGKRAAVFAGPGNNGGDGFVVARYLFLSGAAVDLFIVGPAPSGKTSAANLRIAERIGIKPVRIRSASALSRISRRWDFIVDALFGTGGSRPLTGLYASAVRAINACEGNIYAVDIPSGLHADTGEIMGRAVKADVTIALGFKKRGFFFNDGPSQAGEICTADISLDERWADAVKAARVFETGPREVQTWFPKRKAGAHKGSCGHVLVLAGSSKMSGAAVLASKAALRAGAGLVTLAVPQSAHTIVKSQLVEVMTEILPDDGEGRLDPAVLPRLLRLCEKKQSLVIGPGLILHSGLRLLLEKLIRKTSLPVVLDAAGISAFGPELPKLGRALSRVILTPHPGEMSQLTGKTVAEIQKARFETARKFSDRSDATVVLKGANTVIALRDGDTYINPTGNPGMATAGTGDVLAGVIGAYLAQGLTPDRAAIAGAFNHGAAGDRAASKKGARGLLASDLIEELPWNSR